MLLLVLFAVVDVANAVLAVSGAVTVVTAVAATLVVIVVDIHGVVAVVVMKVIFPKCFSSSYRYSTHSSYLCQITTILTLFVFSAYL